VGVVDDLGDHLPTGFRIPPELAFSDNQISVLGDVQVIDIASRRRKFEAYRDDPAEPRLNLVHRQELRKPKDQLLQPTFVVLNLTTVKSKGIKQPRRPGVVQPIDEQRRGILPSPSSEMPNVH
jgi:hypothetical protein